MVVTATEDTLTDLYVIDHGGPGGANAVSLGLKFWIHDHRERVS